MKAEDKLKEMEYTETLEQVSPLEMAAYNQDKALFDIQIATAKQWPRNLKKCTADAITVVTLSKEIAESCTYSLEKGGVSITGPSSELAKIIIHQMGNMRIESTVTGSTQTHVTASAYCFDLEKNIAYRCNMRGSIVGKKGRYPEDLVTLTGNALASKALRNAIFVVVGKQIVDTVYNEALDKITGDLSDETKLMATVNRLAKGFKDTYPDKKLTDYEIAKSVGRKTLDHITQKDIVVLLGYEKTLRETDATFESIFRPELEKITPPNPVDKSEDRLISLIKNAKDKKTLQKLETELITNAEREAYDEKFNSFK